MKNRISAICLALAVTASLTVPAFAAAVKRPVLTSVSAGGGVLNTEDVEYDYPVTVAAKGSDSAIGHITVQFENKSNGNMANLVLRDADRTGEDIYTGTLSISPKKKQPAAYLWENPGVSNKRYIARQLCKAAQKYENKTKRK